MTKNIKTDWEKSQVTSIDLIFKQVENSLQYFEHCQKETDLCNKTENDFSADWLKFREMMFDLSSILDYTYFLLCSHYSNKGEPDYKNAINYGFPYISKGIKTSGFKDRDQTEKVINKLLSTLFGDEQEKGSNLWKKIGTIILKTQPKTPVDKGGAKIETINPVISTNEELSHALLRYFRNCCTHRSLIYFFSKEVLVEINTVTNETKFTDKKQDLKEYHYYTLGKGYWVKLPKNIIRNFYERQENPLLDILRQLHKFVKDLVSELMCCIE